MATGFSLRLLGTPALEGPDGPIGGRTVQRHRIGLLALLALAPGQRLSRDKLVALLWPEADSTRARHLLSVALHSLRTTLGDQAILSLGDDLRLDLSQLRVDAAELLAAVAAGDPERVAALHRGPFLDGLFLSEAAEFDEWAARERTRFTAHFRTALETLGRSAAERGDLAAAVHWWRTLSLDDPYNTPAVIGLILALERLGDRGNAIQLAQEHERLMKRELGAEPEGEFRSLIRRLQAEPIRGPTIATTTQPLPLPEPDDHGLPSPEPVLADRGQPPRLKTRVVALGGALLIAAAGVAAVIIGFGNGSEVELVENRVVVAHFENRTGDPSLEPVGFMVADWITKGVVELGLGEIVSSDEGLRSTLTLRARPEDTSSVGLARTLARDTRARLLITGSYYQSRDSIVFRAQVIDAGTGRVLRALDEVRRPLEALPLAVTGVRDRVVGALATVLDERMASWSNFASQPPSVEAFRHYSAGMDAFLRANRLESDATIQSLTVAAEQFRAAAALDSAFTAPVIWGVYADWNRGKPAKDLLARLERRRDQMPPWDRAMTDHVLAHDRRDWHAAVAAAEEALRYAPDSEWSYKLAYAAILLNRPRLVVTTLQQLDPTRGWIRNWPSYWLLLANASHDLGEFETEVEAARRMRLQHSTNQNVEGLARGIEIRALLGLGDIALASRRIEEALEPPGLPWLPSTLREFRIHGPAGAADSAAAKAARFLVEADAREPPGSPIGRRELLEVLREAGRFEEAGAVASSFKTASIDGKPGLWDKLMTIERHELVAIQAAMAARRHPTRWIDPGLAGELRSLEQGMTQIDSGYMLLNQAQLQAEIGQFGAAVELVKASLAIREQFGGLGHGSRLGVLLRDYEPFQRLMRPKD